jgi:hypothetical protein
MTAAHLQVLATKTTPTALPLSRPFHLIDKGHDHQSQATLLAEVNPISIQLSFIMILLSRFLWSLAFLISIPRKLEDFLTLLPSRASRPTKSAGLEDVLLGHFLPSNVGIISPDTSTACSCSCCTTRITKHLKVLVPSPPHTDPKDSSSSSDAWRMGWQFTTVTAVSQGPE